MTNRFILILSEVLRRGAILKNYESKFIIYYVIKKIK